MTPFAIGGLQLEVHADRSNFDHIRGKIDLMMHLFPWVQMVVVSELATFGPLTTHAQPLPGPTEEEYRRIAARHGIWLIPGSLFELKDGLIYNTAPVIAPDGTVIGRHRKLFPFLPYESGVESGTDFVVWDVDGVGRFGISICYDMWFPETSRTLAVNGAEVIIHPTLTGTIDREVELSIARATAACNQCFVIDVNGSADGGNGRSTYVGPVGDVLYTAGHGEEMIPIEIDIDRVRRTREVGLRGLGQPLKSFRDRKVDFSVYREGSEYLNTLGTLEKMSRGSRAGLSGGVATGQEDSVVTPPENGEAPAEAARGGVGYTGWIGDDAGGRAGAEG